MSLDPSGVYRQAGLIVEGPPLPFVGSIQYLAGSTADSTLVLLSLSLANRALTFTADGNVQRAVYDVTIDVAEGAASAAHEELREVVRVASFKEAQRADESVVFQHFLPLAPGAYVLTIAVRDEGAANVGGQQVAIAVPRFSGPRLSSPILAYESSPRQRVDTMPSLIVNPRATVVFGRDSVVPVYLEAYHVPGGSRLLVTVSNDREAPLVTDTVPVEGQRPITATRLSIPVSELGVGRLALAATIAGSADTVRSPLFVSFGDELGIGSFDELLSYLRYYAAPEVLQTLRDAAAEQRATLWAEFWRRSDPNPVTPEHEGLRAYFARIQSANQRFVEEGGPGWLTDRGKVFVTFGEPDQILEQNTPGAAGRGRAQLWQYGEHHVEFAFVDQNGFGRWRLTPASEADYEAISRRERVH